MTRKYRPGPLQSRRMIETICEVVGEIYQVDVEDIMGVDRCAQFARPRLACYALAREITGGSFPEIGRAFGRNATTIMSGINRARSHGYVSPALRDIVARAVAAPWDVPVFISRRAQQGAAQ